MFELPTITQGSGPDVVLVHGALGDQRQWEPIAAALAPRFRTHAVSRRHHWPGPMPAAAERYTYELHRDDVLGLIDRLGGPVHLVGHSYGAGVVLLAALQAPERVRSLTLIEPAFGSLLPEAGPGLAEEKATRMAALNQVRALVGADKHLEAAEVFIDWVQGGPGGFSSLPEAARQGLHDNARTLGPTIAGSQPDVSPASLRGLRMPSLVVIGEQTRGFYRLIGEVTAGGIPGGRLAKLPGCSHMTIVEAPEGTATLLGDFLSR
ncbi:MAG TPA: alpha/beta hydrolase [Vicinamibacterales bacterium]|jgi:pimeloyl-ACP methyl ester carboxylesterase|nr:alpha/beta hydrolase [Vicinamibacterales bacterium]